MNDLHQTYESKIDVCKQELSLVKHKIVQTIVFRLLIFLATAVACYFLSFSVGLAVLSGIVGLIGFLFLVRFHGKLDRKKNYLIELIKINQTEIAVLKGNYDQLENGKEFLNPEHEFSYDIELFGEGSFFQFFNRTKTLGGRKKLAKILGNNELAGIEERQKAIKELAKNLDTRQHFMATAGIVKTTISSDAIEHWLFNYKAFASDVVVKILLLTFPVISIVLIGLLSVDLIHSTIFVIWFLLGLFITGSFLKKINQVAAEANKIADTINQYAELLKIIETSNYQSEILKNLQQNIATEQIQASQMLNQLGRSLDRLNSRNNFVVAIFGNALVLWDILSIHLLEKWIKNYSVQVEKWFDAIYTLDAIESCANFTYNHSAYCFPIINNDEHVIEATDLGHPLIESDKRISNDFHIDKNNFIIITGANMAGKSTFLRTLSLSIVLANAGMPVCAKIFKYSPIKLITSMRTSDSLQKEESYFFSELKRLKFIVDRMQQDAYFIILDEILKGTNSKDKEMGSKKFVERLVSSGSTGIIATHDLGLCEIHQRFPQVINHYFDAEIINDELHFDYKFKDGICQNMNASFLLKKMDIVKD